MWVCVVFGIIVHACIHIRECMCICVYTILYMHAHTHTHIHTCESTYIYKSCIKYTSYVTRTHPHTCIYTHTIYSTAYTTIAVIRYTFSATAVVRPYLPTHSQACLHMPPGSNSLTSNEEAAVIIIKNASLTIDTQNTCIWYLEYANLCTCKSTNARMWSQ